MKQIKINIPLFSLFLLSLLLTGCKKDNVDPTRIRIFAESLNSNSGKVWVDPVNNTSASASWIVNEAIDINGSSFSILERDNHFYLDNVPTDGMRYAVYPATTSIGGNDLVVVNNGEAGTSIKINQLAINFRNGGHDIVFPMAARSAANADTMRFRHLTGGFRLNLKANTSDCTLKTIKVVVQGTGSPQPVTVNGTNYTTSWAVQGPTLPVDTIGDITTDLEIMYSSEMVFNMQTNGVSGVTVSSDGISFCIPVTICTARRLSISGFDNNNSPVFMATKDLDNINVLRNYLYSIPTININ